MIHLKEYNRHNKTSEDPEVGDFFIVETDWDDDYWDDILNNNVGQIKKIGNNVNPEYLYKVLIGGKQTILKKDEIIYWSKDISEMEAILNAKKFNL